MKADPILWIPSDILFDFISQRFQELLNIQQLFSAQWPPDYATIITLLLHLMWHSMVTPQIEYHFLHSSLRDLEFEEVMMSFGIFFLHGLDVKTRVLSDIAESNDMEAQQAYGKVFIKHHSKKKGLDSPSLEVTNSALQNKYPWGTSISWKVFEELLSTSV